MKQFYMCSTITVVKELDAEPHSNSYSFDSLIIDIELSIIALVALPGR